MKYNIVTDLAIILTQKCANIVDKVPLELNSTTDATGRNTTLKSFYILSCASNEIDQNQIGTQNKSLTVAIADM